MSKKTKIIVNKDQSLEEVDAQLDDVMSALDQANERVSEVLEGHFNGEDDAPGNDRTEAPKSHSPVSNSGASDKKTQ